MLCFVEQASSHHRADKSLRIYVSYKYKIIIYSIQAALCASAFPNLLKRDGKKLKCKQHKKVRLHNSSVLVHPRIGKVFIKNLF